MGAYLSIHVLLDHNRKLSAKLGGRLIFRSRASFVRIQYIKHLQIECVPFPNLQLLNDEKMRTKWYGLKGDKHLFGMRNVLNEHNVY